MNRFNNGRQCFTLRIDPAKVDAYAARHAEVWPEMRDALRDTGWRNYSLFLTDDGLLIGYVEMDDLAAGVTAMSTREVNARWQESMAEFFTGIDTPADQAMTPIREVFHLD